MKKGILILTIFVFALSLVSSLAFAQSSTSSDKQIIKERGITRMATSSGASTTLSKLEQRNEKIRNFSAQMQQRLNVIVNNLEKIALRVETQINKLASSTATSTDFSASQAKLSDAKKKIDELKTGIAGLDQKVEEIIASKTPKTAFYMVREKLVKVFVSKIKVIHKELLDSVKLAKKEIIKLNQQENSVLVATSTISTTTTSTSQ